MSPAQDFDDAAVGSTLAIAALQPAWAPQENTDAVARRPALESRHLR